MTHFGLVCVPTISHLNTMLSLGQELQRRGHRVTLFGIPDAKPSTLAMGLGFQTIGESEFPSGAVAQFMAQQGKLAGIAVWRHLIRWSQNLTAIFLKEAPQVLKRAGVEALLVDAGSVEGGTVAEFLNIPFATINNAVMCNQEAGVPPHGTPWSYSPTRLARLRNQVGYAFFDLIDRPTWKIIFEYRRKWKLPIYSSYNDYYSPLAQLSQMPAEFEFPRTALPQWFHFTGLYHSSVSREFVSFPYEKLTGQPLIYASLGTLLNRQMGIFHQIASACEDLDAQLVISLGRATSLESFPELPGSPLVVGYAPQLELLQKTTLMITHAGLNTTLECLNNGVPMVAVPIAYDQPGIAARLAWTGAGEVVPLARLSISRLRSAIERVLTENSYKNSALRLQKAMHQLGGVSQAADIIEQMVATQKPVLAQR